MLNRSYLINIPCLTLILLLTGNIQSYGQGQNKTIPRDTTFNVKSAYLKEVKRFPFIEIVESQLPENVLADKDVAYARLEDTSYGERVLHMDVFYPKRDSEKPFPGVVLIHGGGWRSGDRSHLVPLAQLLAAEGYVTATVEYRLSLEAQYPAAIYDVKSAIKWIKSNAGKYNLDKTKLAVLGCSSGAQMASLIGVTNGMEKFDGYLKYTNESSDVQAVVNMDGIVSFVHPEAAAEGEAASAWLGGGRTERPDNWKEASPLEYVDENTPPFLFVNSSIPRFHAGRDDMVKKLDGFGIYSEINTIQDTPHPFWLFHPWFEEAFSYTHNFLDKIFKPNNSENN